jgi:hypothetical protein
VVVIQPELADDDEADQPAEELREELAQVMAELAGAPGVPQRGHLQLEDEQRHDDREHAVAERLDPVRRSAPRRKRLSSSTRLALPSRTHLAALES